MSELPLVEVLLSEGLVPRLLSDFVDTFVEFDSNEYNFKHVVALYILATNIDRTKIREKKWEGNALRMLNEKVWRSGYAIVQLATPYLGDSIWLVKNGRFFHPFQTENDELDIVNISNVVSLTRFYQTGQDEEEEEEEEVGEIEQPDVVQEPSSSQPPSIEMVPLEDVLKEITDTPKRRTYFDGMEELGDIRDIPYDKFAEEFFFDSIDQHLPVAAADYEAPDDISEVEDLTWPAELGIHYSIKLHKESDFSMLMNFALDTPHELLEKFESVPVHDIRDKFVAKCKEYRIELRRVEFNDDWRGLFVAFFRNNTYALVVRKSLFRYAIIESSRNTPKESTEIDFDKKDVKRFYAIRTYVNDLYEEIVDVCNVMTNYGSETRLFRASEVQQVVEMVYKVPKIVVVMFLLQSRYPNRLQWTNYQSVIALNGFIYTQSDEILFKGFGNTNWIIVSPGHDVPVLFDTSAFGSDEKVLYFAPPSYMNSAK